MGTGSGTACKMFEMLKAGFEETGRWGHGEITLTGLEVSLVKFRNLVVHSLVAEW